MARWAKDGQHGMVCLPCNELGLLQWGPCVGTSRLPVVFKDPIFPSLLPRAFECLISSGFQAWLSLFPKDGLTASVPVDVIEKMPLTSLDLANARA